jgi:hypothetical protein
MEQNEKINLSLTKDFIIPLVKQDEVIYLHPDKKPHLPIGFSSGSR